ncbi:MAG: hypothetical protein R3C20_23110, partial [Planctomycetaceae bacterium]
AIPDAGRFLFCLVDNIPTRIVVQRNDTIVRYLIPVPQSGVSGKAFDVKFALSGRMNSDVQDLKTQFAERRLQVPVPTFPEFRDDPEFGISISRNRWSVYVPQSWSASLVEDSQRTNVISADVRSFEDASLLSTVEQTNWLLNSLSAAKDSLSRRNLYRELKRNEAMIQQLQGNETETRGERDQVLNKIQSEMNLDMDSDRDGLQIMGEPGSFASGSGSNLFLYESDLNQNGLVLRSNGDFVADNRAHVSPGDQFGVSGQLFGFQLSDPELKLDETESLGRLMEKPQSDRVETRTLEEKKESADRAIPRFGQLKGSKQPSASNASPQREAQRSKLLERRQSGQQPEPAARPSMEEQSAINQVQNFEQSPVFQSDNKTMEQQVSSAESTGLLSLQFEIPSDGVRMDFVRPGGNASLALDVRSAKTVQTGLGLLWALACGAAAIFLLTTSTQFTSFLRRACLLSALVGMAGWLLSDERSFGWFASLAIISLLVYSVLLIRSERRAAPTV